MTTLGTYEPDNLIAGVRHHAIRLKVIPTLVKLGHDDWLVNISDILNLRYVSTSVQQYYRIHENNTKKSFGNWIDCYVLFPFFIERLHACP